MTRLTLTRSTLLQRAAAVALALALGGALTACSTGSTPTGDLQTPTGTGSTAGTSSAGAKDVKAPSDNKSDSKPPSGDANVQGVAKLNITGGASFTFALGMCAISADDVLASGADEKAKAWFDADLVRADDARGASAGGVSVDLGATTRANDSDDGLSLDWTEESFTMHSMGKDAVSIRGDFSDGTDARKNGLLVITCTG